MSTATRSGLAAALLYFAVALFANRAVLADPFTLLPTPVDFTQAPKPGLRLVYEADQSFVVTYMARVARAFAFDPWKITEVGLCNPMQQAYTLGEHMFGEGLLGALPYRLTQDPIFTFNAVSVLSTWLSLLAIYVLAFYWTGSFAAAFLAGLLFGLIPSRLNNPAHIFVFSNAWSALALVAVHRLFARERWLDAALLTLFLCLQLLESFYPVLGLAIIGGAYGLLLSIKHIARLPRLAPKLLVVAAVTGCVAWLLFGPYLETQETWGVLQARKRMLLAPHRYWPGEAASPGWFLSILAAVGLLDRVRGARDPDDPRGPLLVAGFLIFWCSVWFVSVPGLGRLSSPLVSLAAYVPGIDSVRALAALQHGVFLVLSVFAAYAVLALLERLPRFGRAAVTTVLAAGILLQTFHPPTARATFAATADLVGKPSRPPEETLDLLSQLPDGAVLDLPLSYKPRKKLQMMPGYLRTAGYYDQPTAACYNSFLSGLQTEVERLVEALPDPKAAKELSALGFRSLLVHRARSDAEARRLEPLLTNGFFIEPLGDTEDLSAYRLTQGSTTNEFAAIANKHPGLRRQKVTGNRADMAIRFRRGGGATFRHPDPIEPSDILIRVRKPNGDLVAESAGRMLLPLALATGGHTDRRIEVEVPEGPAVYRVEVVRAAEPDLVLATRILSVR